MEVHTKTLYKNTLINMKKLSLLATFLIVMASCTINPMVDENGKRYEGNVHKCSTFFQVSRDILKLNLESLEGEVFSLKKISEILGNPLNKKNIDSIEYYYFGTPGETDGCSVTVPVKNNKIGISSVFGKDSSCTEYAWNSINKIGNFYWEQTSLKFGLGEGGCGDVTIYKRSF